MKRILLTSLLIALFGLNAFAEEQTLLGGNRETHWGGFGGPAVYYTQFKGDANVMVGGGGAVSINKTIYLGAFGAGIGHHPNAPDAFVDQAWRHTRYEMSYGGGVIGFVCHSDNLLHSTVDVMIGGGELRQNIGEGDGDHNDYPEWSDRRASHFFAVQPMAHLEVNVVKWMRADLGAGYRFTSGVSMGELRSDDVRGPVAGLGLRFGKF